MTCGKFVALLISMRSRRCFRSCANRMMTRCDVLRKRLRRRGLNRNDAREVRRQEMGPRVVPDNKPYTFKYASPDKDFNCR